MTPALLLGGALLLTPSPPARFLPHEPTVDVLDNGLTLVTVPQDSPGVVAYFTLVKAGSRDEVEPGKSGYAHLFEHLMFRGTDKTPAAEYEHKIQALGVDSNARTTSDFTLYVPTLPKESLPAFVPLEADRFMHLSYSPAAYKDETGAVLGEYNKIAANPSLPMAEALRALAFTAHSYGHTTIGSKHDVLAMPAAYEYSRSFFQRFYTPDDCIIFAVGDVDHAEILALVRASYGAWTGKRAVTKAAPEPEQTAPRAKAIEWKGPTLPRLMEGFKVPATGASLKDAAALAVVAALAFGEPSELYQRLVVKEQKVVELEADPDELLSRDPGLFWIVAKLRPKSTFEEVTAAVDQALAAVAAGKAPPEEVEAAKAHLLSELTLKTQTPQELAGKLAAFATFTGDPLGLEAYAAALPAVTPEDVARVTKAYLVPSRRTVVTLTGPAGGRR